MKEDVVGRAFSGRKPPGVVAAFGPETFLREETLRATSAAFLGAADSPDVVVIQPDASTESPADTAARFLGEVRTASLFGGRKIAALRDADAVVAASKAAFLAWLAAAPNASVVGVLLAEELPAEVVGAVENAGLVVRCGGKGAAGEAPVAFVKRRAAERGKRIGQAEAEMLVERVGDELSFLDNAVEILCLHAGNADTVAAEDVDALFRSAREGTIWEFGDLLAEGEVAQALTEAKRCFDEGVPEYGASRVTLDERRIASLLVNSFVTSVSRGLAVRRQLDAGVPRGDVQYAGPAFRGFLPWKAKERVTRLASRRRSESLEALLLRAEETERGMKSGGADGRLAVARLATAVGTIK